MEKFPSNTRHLPADFNLRNLATIAYAATFWNESNIAPFFDKTNPIRPYAKHAMDAHYAHISNVLKKAEKTFKSANFPKKISDLILQALKMMGQRIAVWCEYAQEALKINKEAIPNVFWTAHGTVDEWKILQNSKAVRDDLIPPLEALYLTACSSVSIDYIKLNWKKILLFCEIHSRADQFSSTIWCSGRLKFISCSVIFLAKLELSQLFPSQTQYFQKYKYPEKESMFWLSMEEGCPEAVRHYWSLLHDLEKREMIQKAADFSLRNYQKNESYDFLNVLPQDLAEFGYIVNIRVRMHKCKGFADILIFFITRMTDHEIKKYLTTLKEDSNRRDYILIIFEVLMCHCPLEEYLPLAFELALTYCEVKNGYKVLINKLLVERFRNKIFGFLTGQTFSEKLTQGLREKFRTENSSVEINENYLLEMIYNDFDLKDLKIIFNDYPADHKKRLITNGAAGFKRLFENQKFHLLKTFKDDILQSEDERNWFMETCFGLGGGFLSNGRTDLMDKLVELFYSTLEMFKNDITNQHCVLQLCAAYICERIVQAADTAFIWMFGSDQGKQNYVDHLVRDMGWVWGIRKKNKVKWTELLTKFMLWLLESPEEVDQFKSGQLASQFALKNLLAVLFELEVDSDGKRRGSEIFKIFQEFLLFCLTLKNAEILIQEIRTDIHEWILFLSGKCCLHFADDFMTWIFESWEKKDEAVVMFLKRNEATFTEKTTKSNWPECNQEVLSSWNETAHILNEIEDANDKNDAKKLENPKYFKTDCGYIYINPRA